MAWAQRSAARVTLVMAVSLFGATAASLQHQDEEPISSSAPSSSKSKSNVLFLFADEMDGRILDPDSPQTKPPLPNLHKLADSGAVFTRTYSQSPQCVPSRSAMMAGLRTDQIEVYDNFVGIASFNGTAAESDAYCIQAFGNATCEKFAESQKAPPTFIDRLYTAGVNVTLYGKMHVGGGLTNYPGELEDFPFSNPSKSFDTKITREWSRGLGPATNVKGDLGGNQVPSLNPSDNVEKPATANDYKTLASCLGALRGGLITPSSTQQQFLYCSILVPHPPYASNKTYMDAVAQLDVEAPEQVPIDQLHPNDVSTALLKHSFDQDQVNASQIKYFRRVYFSMCFEADDLLGQIITALDNTGARKKTFVIMISDHGEDATEHRQCGKNNMYDSASRVAMIISGPGITPGQQITTLASLNDVFPTVLDMAGVNIPSGLAGSSLLPLANGAGDPSRKDFITAQYHSVFSVTGEFMIRQGDVKLIAYGKNQFDWEYPTQLFNLSRDPWELHDIAASNPAQVARLTALLEADMGGQGAMQAIDARCKEVQRDLFTDFVYTPAGGASGCQKFFAGLYGSDFNASDAVKVAQWLQQPCPWPAPAPPDPTCAHGVKSVDTNPVVCCTASCGVCAHPSAACGSRPGGAHDCCPSIVEKANNSCAAHPAPCVL